MTRNPSSRIGRVRLLAIALLGLAFAGSAPAQPEVVESTVDPAIEARLNDLWAELRCMKCAAQSVGDSQSKWATDLRKTTREAMLAGQSEEQIIDDLKRAYGDSVSYKPPIKPSTYILWFGPVLVLLIALGIVVMLVRRKNAEQPAELTEEQHREAMALLDRDDDPKP